MKDNATKKRGRPATGKAMTNAEKQRAYRERKKGNVTGLDLTDSEVTAIVTLLQDKAKSIADCSENVEWLNNLAKKIHQAKQSSSKSG